jgi:GntR family transcriptional regulator
VPELNRETPIPLYYQVSQILRHEIETGKYSPGDYIPTEQELRNRFDVSRDTIRQALSDLIYQGLLERRRTKGTVVSKRHVEAILKDLASFTTEVMDRKLTLVTKILNFRQIQCPDNVCDQLNLSKSDIVTEMERLRFVDDEPVAVEKWYAPIKIFPGLSRGMFKESGLEQSTYYVLMRQYNIKITRAVDTVSAVDLEARDARLIKQPTGAPVLLRTRISYSDDRTPVTYGSGLYMIKLKFALETSRTPIHTDFMEKK